MMSTANNGVATRLAFFMVKSFWPSYSLVDGTIRRTMRSTRFLSGSISLSSWKAIFHAE